MNSMNFTCALLVAAALPFTSAHPAATPAPGIDCGCATVGQYVSPFSPVGLAPGLGGASPCGKYVARPTQSFPNLDIEVTRVAYGRRMVFVGNMPQNTAYRFSPNGEAFDYFTIRDQGSIADTSREAARLHNLAGATSFQTPPVWYHRSR